MPTFSNRTMLLSTKTSALVPATLKPIQPQPRRRRTHDVSCHRTSDAPISGNPGAQIQAMILTCPSCGTRYQTGEAHFKPPGRNVRCAKCRHVWFQSTPELEPAIEPEPVISPAVVEASDTSALSFGAQAHREDVAE